MSSEDEDFIGTTAGSNPENSANDAEEIDEESGAAEDYGLLLGLPLGLIALVWAFVGPNHILTLFRYDLPIIASFREPMQYTYFAYIGGVTLVFALFGAISFPSIRTDDAAEYAEDGEVSGYEADLAIGLITPVAALSVLMVIGGFVFPALFYAVGGDLVRAGQILLGVVVLIVAGFIFRMIAILAIAIWSSPLLIPSFVGSYMGGFLRKILNIGPELPIDNTQDQW